VSSAWVGRRGLEWLTWGQLFFFAELPTVIEKRHWQVVLATAALEPASGNEDEGFEEI
jgi:hypothetical protein